MKDDLIKWKEQYGSIYLIEIESQEIYYRTLTAWEVQSILDLKNNNKAQIDIDNAVVQLAILSIMPDFYKPGSITSLAQAIWNKSSLTDDALALTKDSIRKWATDSISSNFNLALSALLCRILPSLDLVTLLSLSTNKLLKIAAIVETITEIKVLDSETNSKTQAPIKEGYGVSGEQAKQVNEALNKALDKLKK
jgi:hypothetical protein